MTYKLIIVFSFDPKSHPGLNMVRVVMYMFFVFMIMWNVNAALHVFSDVPNLIDDRSGDYCHPTVYYMSFVLVILFVSLAGAFLVLWTLAIIAGN